MSDRELLALIPVFDAIMSEGNLSRAAERLGVTQSAVSQTLARLRKLTSDPLFESHGRGVRPTPRALEIADHARAALMHASAAFTPKTLDIANLKRTFVYRHRRRLRCSASPDVAQSPVEGLRRTCAASSATRAGPIFSVNSSTARPSSHSTFSLRMRKAFVASVSATMQPW